MLKKVLHSGMGVNNLEQAIQLFISVGFKKVKEFHKTEPDADVVVMSKGETAFELFQFDDEHPHVEFIRNHVAFYSDAIEDDVAQLLKAGYKLTIPITEGVIFRYAYLQDASGTNYEIATEKTTPS
jgi:catechol 2,3-dioxygenase-like lactoylglutathione lyase family enzyme